MATYEKPRKGGMYVYNMAPGPKMKPEAAPQNQPTILKKVISKGWGQLTRSRTYRDEIGHHRHDDGGDELIKNRVEEKKIVVDHGRKSAVASSGTSSRRSVSHIEDIKMVEGRKSVCSINELTSSRKSVSNVVEVVKVASMAASFDVKVLVTDMPGFMQVHAFKCARNTFDSLEKFSSRDMACTIKKEFDKVYGPAWHCIVGSSFGSYVTHSTGCFLYFSMEKLYILVFKTKVKKASD